MEEPKNDIFVIFIHFQNDGLLPSKFSQVPPVSKTLKLQSFVLSFTFINLRESSTFTLVFRKFIFFSSSSVRYSSSGNVYSQGWPRSYASSAFKCNTSLEQEKDIWTRFAIMDVDLKNNNSSCQSGDYVVVKGMLGFSVCKSNTNAVKAWRHV